MIKLKAIERAARRYRKAWGKVGVGGVVCVFDGAAYCWKNELRDPQDEMPGSIAVSESGEMWQAVGGDARLGAASWVRIGGPHDQ